MISAYSESKGKDGPMFETETYSDIIHQLSNDAVEPIRTSHHPRLQAELRFMREKEQEVKQRVGRT